MNTLTSAQPLMMLASAAPVNTTGKSMSVHLLFIRSLLSVADTVRHAKCYCMFLSSAAVATYSYSYLNNLRAIIMYVILLIRAIKNM